jgi:hypothetical protein
MPTIQSQSQSTNSPVKDFFVPSFAGGIILFLLGALMLLIYSFNQIINWVGSNYLDAADTLHLNIGVFSNGVSKSFDNAFGGRLGQIIVWSIVGALCYILIWFVKNMFNSFENDVIIDHYLHPKSYSRAGYWGSTMAGIIFFGVILILLVAYTYIALKVIMPGVSALTSSSINDFRLPLSLLYLVMCVLASALLIYLWTRLAKVVAHTWKLL